MGALILSLILLSVFTRRLEGVLDGLLIGHVLSLGPLVWIV